MKDVELPVSANVMLDAKRKAVPPETISQIIHDFPDGYKDATHYVIKYSEVLDRDGEAFMKCVARILSSFGMTRGGPFEGVRIGQGGEVKGKDVLQKCWDKVGNRLIDINRSVRGRSRKGASRDRHLLELTDNERDELFGEVWSMTKLLLPITMSDYSYGLVGASKVLFAVLPEVVLPVDSSQWLKVFKTADLGDILRHMVYEIHEWEHAKGKHLNEMDSSKRLTTLPSVYNVMAMHARPK